jgi:3'(2'), 5'-bisphosphate nucleotidase
LNTDITTKINSKEFDDCLLNIAYESIHFILKTKINFLNTKSDGSPLTEADICVDEIINKNLKHLCSKTKVISEEKKYNLDSYLEKSYWIIDPIDGTNSYLNGGEEYTVNIALIVNGVPQIGLIAHPPSKKIWYAKKNKLKIIKNKKTIIIKKNKITKKNIKAIITSKETNKTIEHFLKSYKGCKIFKMSSSLKFCLLAEKKADIYPRFSVINKWDIAAGHAILNAAGGVLLDLNGKNFFYNTKSSKTTKFFAFSDKTLLNNFKFKF